MLFEILNPTYMIKVIRTREPAEPGLLIWTSSNTSINPTSNTLILEDEADWDVAIRSQMKNISTAVRQLTHTSEAEVAPYGRSWDVLWLGHCGEFWGEEVESVIFDDAHVCPHEHYLSWAASYRAQLPDRQRAVYWSRNPVCTFAYAVSHEGAGKTLQFMGAGQGESFDVQLMVECGRNLKCISVLPEVFHRYFPPAGFNVKSDVQKGNGEDFESVMGTAENIVHSARCQALWGQDCQKLP